MKATKLKPPARIKVKGVTYWQVTAPAPTGGRIRRTFQDKQDAVIFFERSKVQSSQFGAQAMELSDRLRGMAIDGARKLEPFNATIAEAVNFYLAHLQTREGGVILAHAAKELLSARTTEGASPAYIQTLKSRLNRFIAAFHKDKTTREISTGDIDAFLAKLEAAPGTANTFRRVLKIPANACKWLRPLVKKDGPVMPADFRRRFDRARVRTGFRQSFAGRDDQELQHILANAGKLKKWPSNCLRHGAISYALAVSRDIGRTATEAGNSPAVIARHYLELVKPSAAAFFDIVPEEPANVTAFKAA